VTVVTSTPGDNSETKYSVVRRPSFKELWALASETDIVFQNLISLRTLVPLILSGKPIVVTHQSWMRKHDGSRGLENLLKLLAVRLCRNVSISQAIADDLPVKSYIIGNPFDDSAFEASRTSDRPKDIIFMGRLVSYKGCDVLLRALGILRTKRIVPMVTIIGHGSEMESLKSLAEDLELSNSVSFLGAISAGRGEIVAQHQIMVVPSLWAEPFGIVALEGIASGCALVASAKGGLGETVGPCGLLFANGNFQELASVLERVLMDQELRQTLVSHGPKHLERFRPGFVSKQYLDLFQEVLKS